jgi:hypothetical protein
VSPSHAVEEAEARCRESLRAGQGHFFSVEAEAGVLCALQRVRQDVLPSEAAEVVGVRFREHLHVE